MNFFFTNRREAEKSVKLFKAKYPEEEFPIYEEEVWTAEDIYETFF